MTFRISADTRALIAELAEQRGVTATDIVELGVKTMFDEVIGGNATCPECE